MTEEPEQMQEQDRITPAFRNKEGCPEIPVSQQHGDGTRQNRHSQQQQEGGYKHRPDEKRHLVKRHAGRAHIENRGDEIRGTKDRGHAGKVQREDRQIHRHAGRTGR